MSERWREADIWRKCKEKERQIERERELCEPAVAQAFYQTNPIKVDNITAALGVFSILQTQEHGHRNSVNDEHLDEHENLMYKINK